MLGNSHLVEGRTHRPAGRGTTRVVVVGVCGSGKSELVKRLKVLGVNARSVAQEHSHVPELWRHEAEPDVLVYLGASKRTVHRRGRSGLSTAELAEQRRRLASARRYAHVRIQTDALTPADVLHTVLAYVDGGVLSSGVPSLSTG